jgi:hypothetical protein
MEIQEWNTPLRIRAKGRAGAGGEIGRRRYGNAIRIVQGETAQPTLAPTRSTLDVQPFHQERHGGQTNLLT